MTKDSLQSEIEQLERDRRGISPALEIHKRMTARIRLLEKQLELLQHEGKV